VLVSHQPFDRPLQRVAGDGVKANVLVDTGVACGAQASAVRV
jgi:hypothetical protein